MKVYVVVYDFDYESYEVLAVFGSEEAAKEYMKFVGEFPGSCFPLPDSMHIEKVDFYP